MNELHQKCLELVERNNGKFSWYQIDRALSEIGVGHAGKLMVVLRELIASGLIRAATGENPAQPVYWITDEGSKSLQGTGTK